MTTSKLYVRMSYIEGALNRLLGTACRRGFDIASVDARRATDDTSVYEIVLELISTRSIATLERQIDKLYDVRYVEVLPADKSPRPAKKPMGGGVAA